MLKTSSDLHARLAQVLPPIDSQVEEWSAWPYLSLELPRTETDKIDQARETERLNISRQIITDHALVVRSDARAAQLFGKQGLPTTTKFRELLTTWKDKYPDAETTWVDSCCEQIMVCARRGFPVICWAAMREIGGDCCFTPVVTRVQRLPFAGTVQFDVHFFNLSDQGRGSGADDSEAKSASSAHRGRGTALRRSPQHGRAVLGEEHAAGGRNEGSHCVYSRRFASRPGDEGDI